jgi:hypothetical protein
MVYRTRALRRSMTCFLAASCFQVMAAPCKTGVLQRPDSQYQAASADGQLVLDKATGLVWMRCSVGQQWKAGACDGTPQAISWHDAAALGRKEAAQGWRLPTHRELLSLVDGSCFGPSINRTWFPDTPGEDYWTSTSSPDDPDGKAWTIEFFEGRYKPPSNKNSSRHVRLVRMREAR